MSRCVKTAVSKRLKQKLDQLLWKINGEEESHNSTEEMGLAQEDQNRRVVIDESLGDEAVNERVKDLLALGPKFVPTMGVTKSVQRKVEAGIE